MPDEHNGPGGEPADDQGTKILRDDWPMPSARPSQRSGISAVELDENLALYDDVGQLLILLNSSAAAVWELCDGMTTFGKIVEILAGPHPAEADLIAEDVRQTVRKLAELELVNDLDGS